MVLCILLVGLSTSGCVTTTTTSAPTVPSSPITSASTKDINQIEAADTGVDNGGGGRISADDAVAGDASAARLHDIEGTLLMYYALYHRMPQRLEELKPLADADTDLQLVAPSGRPYLYVPDGLVAAGTSKRIIVADPAPSLRTASRQCILAPPLPMSPRASLSMEVLAVPEAAFKRYVPAE